MAGRTIKTSTPLEPYKQGETAIEGQKDIIKLSSNELPYPPSPAALQAFVDAQAYLSRYPDGSQFALREAISKIHGISANNIFAGNGSEEAIGLVIRSVLSPSDEMIISENSFKMAEIYANSVGAKITKCPERDYRIDVQAILAAITEDTKIVYLCSPNNPTGTYTKKTELFHLETQLPKDVILIIDAAYAEFVGEPDYDSGLALFSPHGRVVVTRTFSKAYGLAAQRIGWAAAPDKIIDAVACLRTPFNTNTAAQNAATAAVLDQNYLKEMVARIQKTRDAFSKELRGLGLTVVPSQANFVLIIFSPHSTDVPALDAALKEHGILGRPATESEHEFRLSIGTDDEMAKTISVIRKWVQTPRKEQK